MDKLISVIIPVYNEQDSLKGCLESLGGQSYKPLEIIVVDDGSTDKSQEIAKRLKAILLKQNHRGPGVARNLGAQNARGNILVFVDADMVFEKDFIKDLTEPIAKKETIGTFSKNEYVTNYKNPWSVCWNINRNCPSEKMIPQSYPDTAPVFRAILKSEFQKVSGFETSGDYTDDWSLSLKLNQKSTLAKGAKYYHENPSTLKEIWKQARWIGKNKFITGNISRKLKSIILYNPLASIFIAVFKSFTHANPRFVIFKLVYDFAVICSVLESTVNKNKYK